MNNAMWGRRFRLPTLLLLAAPMAFAQRGGPPVAGSASVKPTGSSLGTIRLGGQDDKIWFGWRVGIPSTAFRQLTFAEAAAKADALGLGGIEGFDTQTVSPEVPKNLDYNLMPGECTAVRNRLIELNVKMYAYHVASFPAENDARRKLFDFAKSMGVNTIISGSGTDQLADLEKLASDSGIDIALESRTDPQALMSAISARGKRIGIAADLPAWTLAGIQPAEALNHVKNRLMAVTVGQGVGQTSDFFLSAFRMEIKPLFVAVDRAQDGGGDTAGTYADLARSIAALEAAWRPAMTARVAQVVDSPAGAIRGPGLLSADMRRQIDAAVPRRPIVQPKKPRKLLVVDLQMYSGHSSIPHGNLMLELMGKYTGAFEPTFSNDLANLKYPKIRQFDAVYLNNVCGMVFPDQEVRDGILRFVREGGGIGGHHAVTFANNDWPEFMEMMGAWAGAHHTETQVLKVDDLSSPLTAMFGGKDFEHNDEFYHMPVYSPYSREKQHVLLSIDVAKSDMATAGRFCKECTRPDRDYAVSWIKTYGKGRVFCSPLGHTTIFYTSPAWEQHILAAVQYILGDLDADATPSAKLSSR
jgi:type 1 glutamine amidotransferase/sugar phosphate isomerase/epimerase